MPLLISSLGPRPLQVACHAGQVLNDPDFRDVSTPLDQSIVQTIEAFAQRHLPGVNPEVGIIEHCMYTVGRFYQSKYVYSN